MSVILCKRGLFPATSNGTYLRKYCLLHLHFLVCSIIEWENTSSSVLSEGAMVVVVHGYGIGYTEMLLLCLWIISPRRIWKGDLAFPIKSPFEFPWGQNDPQTQEHLGITFWINMFFLNEIKHFKSNKPFFDSMYTM